MPSRLIAFTLFLFLSFNIASFAQSEKKHKHKISAVYFSWGYNTEWYTKSTVHVKQNELGNYYDLMHVEGHDHRGWDEGGGIFKKALTIPQYNYRLGFFLNERQTTAFEINFDHTKYIIGDGQTIRLKGTHSGMPTDTNIVFSEKNGFYYYLNNGANFLLFNLVKRRNLYQGPANNLRIDFMGKIGIGPLIPHVENSFFGAHNTPGFQIGGWNAGIETAVRATIMRYAYLELSQKVDYARYSNLKVYEGTARQSFGTYELILSLGFVIPTYKHNPMFAQVHNTAGKE